jgi:hypothetical protein
MELGGMKKILGIAIKKEFCNGIDDFRMLKKDKL